MAWVFLVMTCCLMTSVLSQVLPGVIQPTVCQKFRDYCNGQIVGGLPGFPRCCPGLTCVNERCTGPFTGGGVSVGIGGIGTGIGGIGTGIGGIGGLGTGIGGFGTGIGGVGYPGLYGGGVGNLGPLQNSISCTRQGDTCGRRGPCCPGTVCVTSSLGGAFGASALCQGIGNLGLTGIGVGGVTGVGGVSSPFLDQPSGDNSTDTTATT